MTRYSLKEAIRMAKQHYEHACEKHPWFADDVCFIDLGWKLQAGHLKSYLEHCAERHEKGERSYCMAKDVLDAELAEIYAAYCNGDYDQAVYEIYDAIAVLLRMEDMIEDKEQKNAKLKTDAR
jgi:hypothetical protein